MPRGHKPPSQRQLRVGEELRHIIARIIERGEFRDPDLAGRAITVTEVRVSPDLANATAFVIPLGGGDCTAILAGLKRAKAFLRHEIGKQVPNLFFEADHSFDEASRIEAILRLPEVARDLNGNAIPAEDTTVEDAEDGA